MRVNQGCKRSQIVGCHLIPPTIVSEDGLNHQGINVNQGNLQQMQRQHSHLLIFKSVGRHLAALAEEDKIIRTIPVFHHIQPVVNFLSERLVVKILT